jgi:hypothetical protein
MIKVLLTSCPLSSTLTVKMCQSDSIAAPIQRTFGTISPPRVKPLDTIYPSQTAIAHRGHTMYDQAENVSTETTPDTNFIKATTRTVHDDASTGL